MCQFSNTSHIYPSGIQKEFLGTKAKIIVEFFRKCLPKVDLFGMVQM